MKLTLNSCAIAITAAMTIGSSTAQAQAWCHPHFPHFSQTEGKTTTPATPMSVPARGVTYLDPDFATRITRVTNTSADYPAANFLRVDYSRRQAFSPDGTKLMAFSPDGYWHLYEIGYSTYYIKKLHFLAGDAEPQWHPTDSNLFYYVAQNGGTTLNLYNVSTDTSSVAANLTTGLPAWASTAAHIWTKSEGSPSADNRYWGFMVQDGAFNTLGFITWDLVSNTLIGSRQFVPGQWNPDHVSMSPSGRWITISDINYASAAGGTWAWSRDFTTKKKLHHTSEHSDLAVGATGNDNYVSIDYQSNDGDVFFVDIDSCPSYPAAMDPSTIPECPRTRLFTTYGNGTTTALHFSGKGFSKIGWALVSTYGTAPTCGGTMPWYSNKLFAIELVANPRVYEMTHLRGFPTPAANCTLSHKELVGFNAPPTPQSTYWFEPHGTTNRGMTKFAFNSAWTDDVTETKLNIYIATPVMLETIDVLCPIDS